ncbi:MAG: ammonium transporter, partial [Chloroflexi bacterium]|nr:ammonium transporter [Chloroflexota bacterium]
MPPAPHSTDFLSLAWILVCGFLVLFMQAGFMLVTVGFARSRHAGHVALLNLAAFAVSAVAYYLVGFGLQYGGAAPLLAHSALGSLGGIAGLNHEIGGARWGVVGASGFALPGGSTGALALFFFELMFLQTAVYIPVGAAMERVRLGAFLAASAFLAAIVFPLFANWCWGGGFLSQVGQTLGLGHGYVDFAGSSVVHATGGYAGLAIA